MSRKTRNTCFGLRGGVFLLAFGVILLAAFATPSSAGTYYVDPAHGNDSQDGSTGSPWRTIDHAVANAANGSTVFLRSGDYGTVSLHGLTSTRTTWSDAIVFKAAAGNTPVFSRLQVSDTASAYVQFDGINIQCQAGAPSEFGCKVLNASHVKMTNLTITGQWHATDNAKITGFGVWVTGPSADVSDVLIEDCTISQVSIAVQVEGQIRTGVVLRRNTAAKINSSLMRFITDQQNDDILVEYNNIAEYWGIGDPHGSGLSIRNGNMTIRGNIIRAYGGSGGIRFYQNAENTGGVPETGYSNILCEQNLIYGSNVSTGVFANDIGHNFTFRYNTYVGKWARNPPSSGRWRYTGMASFSRDPRGTGKNVSIHNNIFVGMVAITQSLVDTGVVEHDNLMWTFQIEKFDFQSQGLSPDNGTIVVCAGYNPQAPYSNTYFETPGTFFQGGSSFDKAFDLNMKTPSIDSAFRLVAGTGADNMGTQLQVVDGHLQPSNGAPGDTPVDQEPPVTSNPPVLGAIGNRQAEENKTLTIELSATDADGSAITYTYSSEEPLPGASLTGNIFRWTPTYDQAGSYRVTFTASDGQAQDSETITINVANVNRAPTLSQIGDRSIDENRSLTFAVSASDPDGDAVTYSADDLPSGADFTGGTFSWTPSSSQVGSHDITFVASDGTIQDSEVVTIFVAGSTPDGTAPVVARRSPEADAIQVSLNNLVKLHVTDEGGGVDADSVVIRVDGDIVYQGDTNMYQSEYGRCDRSGSPTDYRFIFQANQPFSFDHTVTVSVNAADRSGNVMGNESYTFTTEMRAFGSNRPVSTGSGISGPKSAPTTVGDESGNVWAVWCSGAEGSRNIYVSRMSPESDADTATVAITTAAGDQCNPDITRDNDGVLYVTWQDRQRGNWDIFAAVSSDGITWSRPIQVTDSDNNETHPAIAADSRSPSRVYIVWQDDRDGQADIFAISSANAFADTLTSRLTTDPANQIKPDVAVGAENTAYVVWTDMRNGQADIYGSSSKTAGWANIPIVTAGSEQTSPAIVMNAGSTVLHLLWQDDAPGNADIYYATSDGLPTSPINGVNIVDDTSGADQYGPALVSASDDRVFACWQDRRHTRQRADDTDLFMAELGPASAGTNIFIGDDGTNSGQGEPVIGVDSYGNPYVVWTDARGSRPEIYCAATTFVDPSPLDAKQVSSSTGATIGVDPAAINEPDDVSIIVPAGACQSEVRISISRILNPPVAPAECLGSYDFGPSGIEFEVPVTVTIPYRFSGTGNSAKPYWYDSLTGALSQQGITEIENLVIGSNLNALRFKTTHFTPFYLVAGDVESSDESDGGSAGGCSISTTGAGSPRELVVPYAIVAIAIVILRRRDRRNRRSIETTQG